MLNLTTIIDATTVISAINADINAVCVCVRGVAHSLTERLEHWLFSGSPEFDGTFSAGRQAGYRQLLQRNLQQPAFAIKRMPTCCPAMSYLPGLSTGNRQASAGMARSFGNCDS